MSASVQVEIMCVAGLEVQVYRPASRTDSLPVVLVYLLHGRCETRHRVHDFAQELVSKAQELGPERRRALWVVSFDHRNHGSRLVNAFVNEAWSNEASKHNSRHAIDMYAIQLGTPSRDISMLTDLLPSYLFPDGENEIVDWGVVGISLGGHSAWLSLCHDPRIRTGVPIIGCPDYLALMEHRAKQNELELTPPLFPASLRRLVGEQDPANKAYWSMDPEENPFFGKRVLVLCGAEDQLVPWSQSQNMVEKLEVGEQGRKEVHVYEGVGHKCTAEMQDRTSEFLSELLT